MTTVVEELLHCAPTQKLLKDFIIEYDKEIAIYKFQVTYYNWRVNSFFGRILHHFSRTDDYLKFLFAENMLEIKVNERKEFMTLWEAYL